MNNQKPTEKEMGYWLAITNPTGSWNKYHKVVNNGETVMCYFWKGIGPTREEDIDLLMKEDFMKLAGFDNLEHYARIKHYYDNQPLKFIDLREGMVVWSEGLRQRFTIGKKKDKDSVYANQWNSEGRRTKKYSILDRSQVDDNFFKKSRAPEEAKITVEVRNIAKDDEEIDGSTVEEAFGDMQHAKEEFATE